MKTERPRVNIEIGGGAEEQRGLRLSAWTIVLDLVRAVIGRRERCTVCNERRIHPGRNFIEAGWIEQALPHGCLV